MIVDRIENTSCYSGISPRLSAALRFARELDWMTLGEGRHELDGAQIFALVQEYVAKPLAQGRWEAHRRHIDVQLVIRGAERMGYATVAALQSVEPYCDERDIEFFDGSGDFFAVRAGMFAIFMPQDGHMPGIEVGVGIGGRGERVQPVRKVVIKVAV